MTRETQVNEKTSLRRYLDNLAAFKKYMNEKKQQQHIKLHLF